MGLIERARLAALRITTSLEGFGVPVLFTSLNGDEAQVIARPNKIHQAYDAETGADVDVKKVTVTVSEYTLTALMYPTRNAGNEVAMLKHKVTWADSTGVVNTYSIIRTIPDESLGLIVCICADYKTS